jgi:two-component system sensor histidine kinase and response regulator WspE
VETPEQRLAAGKPVEGLIRLSARHAGGMLHIEIDDDGQGVDLEKIRQRVIERKMATAKMVDAMSPVELMDFLFLPAFSLKEGTTVISGRGVGLDIVQEAIRRQYGTVALESVAGKGMKTRIVLPLTQSVVRALVVKVSDQAYAIPIAKIDRIVTVTPSQIHTLEDKPFFTLEGEHVGLIEAAQILEIGPSGRHANDRPVIVIGQAGKRFGLVVDSLTGEYSLAVQPLEPIFGKMRDVSAGALMENGSPVLIIDVADLLLSIDKLLVEGRLHAVRDVVQSHSHLAKRILVVDDSLTVREMERNLLLSHGFIVDVAIDGMDGWNAVRSAHYDLLITDVDMPRMDGIELVTLVKKDPRLHALPVMIVSYKDRPEDRAKGMHAGADYYLTKGSFHDETLIDAVTDLIGDRAP